jgi:DnaK suppressor protein
MPSDAPTDTPTDYRTLLEGEGAQLRAELSELGFDDGKTGLEYDANFADTSQVTAERGEAEALAGQLKESLEEIAAAIDRLDKGTYGVCEACGVAINPARLEAMPASRFCIDHANRS